MRTLLLMRGAPGCGKSTWIKQHELEQYTLSPDNIRVLCSSTELQPDGTFKISQNQQNEAIVWDILFKLLEYRMSRGEFTVIDATCSKTKDIQKYKDLADSYRYRMFIVDFTSIPLDVCLKQNKMRPQWKHVPDKAIENIYARFATHAIPKSVTIIKPDEYYKILETSNAIIDLSNYKKVVMIGDIHGCYDTLMQYPDFKDGLKEDTSYIFCGDYIDRGNQNKQVLDYIYSIKDLPNVCLLEGNHERSIKAYGDGSTSNSKEFENRTRAQLLEDDAFTQKAARTLYRKFRQFSYFKFHNDEVLACHGGIPHINTSLLYLPTKDFINGVGNYGDVKKVTEAWMSQTTKNQYLVHGHRNKEKDDIQVADRVFNLEGQVEFGGAIRIVELENIDGHNIWTTKELNDIQPITVELQENRNIETVHEALQYLRNNKFIMEKQLGDGISSFNFTREAFYKGNWNNQTILARGLFLDTINEKIIARSYEKFFRIDEVRETELGSLKNKFLFPVTAYVKENGFLAIVSYDRAKDDLFIASKSTNKGEYVDYIKNQLNCIAEYNGKSLYTNALEYFRGLYKDTGVDRLSLVFECIDIDNDPHIIKYEKSHLVLLDGIINSLRFKKIPYKTLTQIADLIGCEVKEKAYEFKDWNSFRDFYSKLQDEDYKYKGKYIEGFVFEDLFGFMTKCKTPYYNQWKKLRGVADQTIRIGYITKTQMLTNKLENMFYGFCKDMREKYYDKENKTYPDKKDIITLRDLFYNNQKEGI